MQDRIYAFRQALLHCIPELLCKFVGHPQTFTSSSSFC